MSETPVIPITNARYFATWWQTRRKKNDADMVEAAVTAGLVVRGVGLLFLTDAGRALRATMMIRRRRKRAKAGGQRATNSERRGR